MVRLQHVLDGWKMVRADSVAAIEEFPAGEFDFQPIPDVASFRQIARHILDAGDALAGVLLSGEVKFSGPAYAEKRKAHLRRLPEDCSPAELAARLRESVEEHSAKLAAKPAEFFAGMVTRPDGQEVTRLEFVQWIKEHELTHRQQLFMYLRLKGIVPVTTRRRLARMAAQ